MTETWNDDSLTERERLVLRNMAAYRGHREHRLTLVLRGDDGPLSDEMAAEVVERIAKDSGVSYAMDGEFALLAPYPDADVRR